MTSESHVCVSHDTIHAGCPCPVWQRGTHYQLLFVICQQHLLSVASWRLNCSIEPGMNQHIRGSFLPLELGVDKLLYWTSMIWLGLYNIRRMCLRWSTPTLQWTHPRHLCHLAAAILTSQRHQHQRHRRPKVEKMSREMRVRRVKRKGRDDCMNFRNRFDPSEQS